MCFVVVVFHASCSRQLFFGQNNYQTVHSCVLLLCFTLHAPDSCSLDRRTIRQSIHVFCCYVSRFMLQTAVLWTEGLSDSPFMCFVVMFHASCSRQLFFGQKDYQTVHSCVLLLLDLCLMFQQHASVSPEWIHSDNCVCCHTGIELSMCTHAATNTHKKRDELVHNLYCKPQHNSCLYNTDNSFVRACLFICTKETHKCIQVHSATSFSPAYLHPTYTFPSMLN